jgi:16S rRNA (adenine1518-N6/adenine1519-N6)-dimethyltransferase
MAQYYCEVESLFDVPPESFSPQPKVQSAIVRITPYKQPPYPANDVKLLQSIVRDAFNQRRKTLRNTLKGVISSAGLEALGVDPSVRPENVSLADYVAITNAVGQDRAE